MKKVCPAPMGIYNAPGLVDLAIAAEFHDYMDRLQGSEREVADLYCYHGLSFQNIGDMLGIPKTTAFEIWQKLLQRFKEGAANELT